MELSALPVEVTNLLDSAPNATVMLFAEPRTNVIRMFNMLAASWINRSASAVFYGLIFF